MTDYPRKTSSWKAAEARRKWHSILGIFVTIVLLLAVVNGVTKSITLGKNFKKSVWDSSGVFSAVVNTKPISVLVFSPGLGDMTLFKLDEDLYVETGGGQFDKITGVYKNSSGQDFAKIIAESARVPIKNYIYFDGRKDAAGENLEKELDGFLSFLFPLKLVFGRVGSVDTNISHFDVFRLWWKAKSQGINDLNLVDLGDYSADVLVGGSTGVLGVDSVSLGRVLFPYFLNEEISQESLEIEVLNKSGIKGAGQLAADYISSLGGRVVLVEGGTEVLPKCRIFTGGDSYTASYLAKLFSCDIVAVSNLAKGKVQVEIGTD